jgi:uncharacterized protein DUF6812
MDTRIQRVVLETPRFRIVGDVTLPTEGFRTRLSDVLNRADTGFIPLVNVEMSPVGGGDTEKLPFAAVARNQIQIAFELESNEQASD